MKACTIEQAKEFQKHAIMTIDLMIDRMRYDKKTELTILDIMNLKDSIKNKKFINALTKTNGQDKQTVSEESK